MMKHRTLILAGFSLMLLSGCASFDAQDRTVLGDATRDNIALQSVRNVDVPNTAVIETSSGVRAAEAVKRLNEGKTTALNETSAQEGG